MATKTKYFSPGKITPSVKPQVDEPAPATQTEAVQVKPGRTKSAPEKKKHKAKPKPASGPTTLQKIERAATKLFAADGVDGVSTKDLAATAGVSEGVIYRYFKSKDELARSLMAAEHTRLTDLLRAAEQGEGRLSQKVAAIVTAYCAFADSDWDGFTYYVLHFHRFKDMAGEASDSPMKAATDIIANAQNRGEIPQGDPALKASMALGTVLQTATSKIYGSLSGDLSDYAPQFNAAVMAVLLSDAG